LQLSPNARNNNSFSIQHSAFFTLLSDSPHDLTP
jgi:hypothetical protein